MRCSSPFQILCLTTTLLLLVGCATTEITPSTSYEDLVALFEEWREFERPEFVDGVPDYTVGAMAAQQRELATYQQRLDAIDPSGWSVEQQIDHRLVRAEMNGLDFDHRGLKRSNICSWNSIAHHSPTPSGERPDLHGGGGQPPHRRDGGCGI